MDPLTTAALRNSRLHDPLNSTVKSGEPNKLAKVVNRSSDTRTGGYCRDGEPVWEKQLDFAHGEDFGIAAEIDSAGDIVISRRFEGHASNESGLVLVKAAKQRRIGDLEYRTDSRTSWVRHKPRQVESAHKMRKPTRESLEMASEVRDTSSASR